MQRLAPLPRPSCTRPDLLLLDEPFSNLDAKLRGSQMRVEVKLLQRRLGITVLFVTHDQVEAAEPLRPSRGDARAGGSSRLGSPAEPL